MPPDHACAKSDKFEALEQRDETLEKAVARIDKHLEAQTDLMKQMVQQGEIIKSLQAAQQEDRRLIELLFQRGRETEKAHLALEREMIERFHAHEMGPGREAITDKKEDAKAYKAAGLGLRNGLIVAGTTILFNFILALAKGFYSTKGG